MSDKITVKDIANSLHHKDKAIFWGQQFLRDKAGNVYRHCYQQADDEVYFCSRWTGEFLHSLPQGKDEPSHPIKISKIRW